MDLAPRTTIAVPTSAAVTRRASRLFYGGGFSTEAELLVSISIALLSSEFLLVCADRLFLFHHDHMGR